MIVSQPSSENRFWPRYFVCRKRSNCSAEISFQSSCFLTSTGNRLRLDKLAANLFANPDLLFLALNVAVLDADLAAISALQNVENLAQRRALQCRPGRR